MWRKLRCISLGKRSQPSNYRTFWKRHDYADSRKVRGCQGLEEGPQRIFTLYDAIIMDACHYTFFQTHVPWCKLWAIMMCLYRFIDGTKCATLVGETIRVWVKGRLETLCYLPLHFVVNLKLLWKKKDFNDKVSCRGHTGRHGYWMNCGPLPKVIHWSSDPQYLRMWLYLRQGSLE